MSSKSLPRVLTIYLLVLAVIIVAAHASSSEEEICRDGRCYPRAFAPTTDFTEVLEGQEIPPGLHVRMDFNTGKKEAKLFDSSDSTSGGIILLDDEGKSLSHKLSDVPEGLPSPPKESPRLKESSASIPLSFRKMEELGALLFSVGDDDLFSASLDILRAPQSETTPEERLQTLMELEDLVYSIDFGALLAEGDGLSILLSVTPLDRLSEGTRGQRSC